MAKHLSFLLLLFWMMEEAACGLTRYLKGNRGDVQPALSGPALQLGGGGEVEPGIQWMINKVRGCEDCATKVDVVVLRSSGADAWNASIYAMKGVDSVESIVLTGKGESNRKDVEQSVRNAEVIFFAGGDQCRHLRSFYGTRVEAAVQSVYQRGGGVGGSSAGVAILSDIIYDACRGSTRSKEALFDPYHHSISFAYDFLHFQYMKDTIADQHLVTRDRIGRTMAFLARQIQEKKATSVLGIAINEDTSLGVDSQGVGVVSGAGPVYFILADHPPEVCQPRNPLTYAGYKIWRTDTGQKFDLKSVSSNPSYYLRSIIKGVFSSNPYEP